MVLSELDGLKPEPEVAVIINVATKYVTTLALLSALRYARIPTVLIDCESRDGSFDWFRDLLKTHDFHLLSAKLRPHGETLDWIFRRIKADRVLLVDSDAEMLNDAMFVQMRRMLDASPLVYGGGFLHQAHWRDRHYFGAEPIESGIGYYMERPWIPFALFRTDPVRTALDAARTFMHRLVLNDIPQSAFLSRLLWRRYRLSFFRRHRLSMLDLFRRRIDGKKPSWISYDTGADLHEYLTKQRGMRFESVSADFVPWSVTHFSGITRGSLHAGATDDAAKLDDVESLVRARLLREYGIDVNAAAMTESSRGQG